MKTKFHTQLLEDIMAELLDCPTKRSNNISALIQKRCHALNEETIQDESLRQLYGNTTWCFPILDGLFSLPWASLPTAQEIQEILEFEIEQHTYSLLPSQDTPDVNEGARELISNIGNPNYWKSGVLMHLASPRLDALRRGFLDWRYDGILSTSNFQMTVMPSNGSLFLECYEYWRTSTLMTGVQVWVVFAPSPENLDKLRAYYQSIAVEYGETDETIHDRMVAQLDGGITLVQKAGQTVFIPPFCAVCVYSVKTSTSAATYISLANKFSQRLQNIPLHLALNQLYQPSTQHTKLLAYTWELINNLDYILQSKIDGYHTVSEICRICNIWDNVKNDVRTLCSTFQNGDEMKATIGKTWISFLEDKRKKSLECRICHFRIPSKDKGYLPQHFWQSHWYAETKGQTHDRKLSHLQHKQAEASNRAKISKPQRR